MYAYWYLLLLVGVRFTERDGIVQYHTVISYYVPFLLISTPNTICQEAVRMKLWYHQEKMLLSPCWYRTRHCEAEWIAMSYQPGRPFNRRKACFPTIYCGIHWLTPEIIQYSVHNYLRLGPPVYNTHYRSQYLFHICMSFVYIVPSETIKTKDTQKLSQRVLLRRPVGSTRGKNDLWSLYRHSVLVACNLILLWKLVQF